VKVDRPLADAVAADQRYERLVVAVEERPHQQDRDAVEPDELQRHLGLGSGRGLDRDAIAPDLDADPQGREDVGSDPHVADLGRVGDRAGLGSQHGGDHVLGDGVLGAAHPHLADQRAVGLDAPGLGGRLIHAGRA
jgi:hypothetical protein